MGPTRSNQVIGYDRLVTPNIIKIGGRLNDAIWGKLTALACPIPKK
jgi:hypothetical protein